MGQLPNQVDESLCSCSSRLKPALQHGYAHTSAEVTPHFIGYIPTLRES